MTEGLTVAGLVASDVDDLAAGFEDRPNAESSRRGALGSASASVFTAVLNSASGDTSIRTTGGWSNSTGQASCLR